MLSYWLLLKVAVQWPIIQASYAYSSKSIVARKVNDGQFHQFKMTSFRKMADHLGDNQPKWLKITETGRSAIFDG